MSHIQLFDYNDLYVIAVGLSMAYIVIETKGNTSYLNILTKINTAFKDWLLNLKTLPQQKEEAIITKIDYYLTSGLLEERTAGVLSSISNRAQKEVNKIKNIEQWVITKSAFYTKADFLNIISCDCFLFGLFVLFIGTFQHKENVHIDGLLQIMLSTMCLLIIHCICFDRLKLRAKWLNLLKPSIPLHTFFFAIALIIGTKHIDQPFISNIDSGWLVVISVFTCFSGFIIYLILNILSNIILAIEILYKILSEVSPQKGTEHIQELNEYENELNKIDKALKDNDLSEMSITPRQSQN